jgi:hypothetical protein
MNIHSPAELRTKLRSDLANAGYLLSEDGTHRLDNEGDGIYHTVSIEGMSHLVLVARANFASSRFVQTFNISNEKSLQRALTELGKTVKPSYMSH